MNMTGEFSGYNSIQDLILQRYAPMLEQFGKQAIDYSKDLLVRVIQYHMAINYVGAITGIVFIIVGPVLIYRSCKEAYIDRFGDIQGLSGRKVVGLIMGIIMCFASLFLVIGCIGALLKLYTIPEIFIYQQITR